MNFRTAGALVLAAVSIPLAAEVYTLGSGTSGGGALKQLGVVPGKPVHTEKVVSGKHTLSLEVYSVNRDFSILAGRLKQLNRSRAALSNGVIRCRTELQDKFVEHMLVINTGKNVLEVNCPVMLLHVVNGRFTNNCISIFAGNIAANAKMRTEALIKSRQWGK